MFLVVSFSKVMPLFFLAIILLTIGEVLIDINSSAFIANNTPISHRRRISSVIPLITGMGYAMGPMIMEKIIDSSSISIGWIVVMLASFIGALGLLILKKLKLEINEE